MSDERYQFRKGVERGKDGKTEEYALLETDLFDSKSSRAARRRGYEAGVEARATAEAIAEHHAEASSSSSSSYVGSSRKDELGLSVFLLLNPTLAAFAAVAAFVLGSFLAYVFGAKSPWSVAGVLAAAAFAVTFAWRTIVWFNYSENRADFAGMCVMLAIAAIGLVGLYFYLDFKAKEANAAEAQTLRGSINLPSDGSWSQPVDVPPSVRCVELDGVPLTSVQVREPDATTWQPWLTFKRKVSQGQAASISQFRARREGAYIRLNYALRPLAC